MAKNFRDYRAKAQFPPGTQEVNNSTSFSGADTSIIFVLPSDSPVMLAANRTMPNASISTLTISSTTSVLPVRATGRAKPLGYNRGARTFAGSMVFPVMAQDPFQQIMNLDAMNNPVRGDGHWVVDQMGPFDILIMCTNEMGESGTQAIFDVKLTNWGTTYSIEDMYLESSYTYIAEHVTPFVSKRFKTLNDAMNEMALNQKASGTDPDTAASRALALEREQHENVYGSDSSDLDGIFVGREQTSSHVWTPQLDLNLGGFQREGEIAFAKKFMNTFGTSPEIPNSLF